MKNGQSSTPGFGRLARIIQKTGNTTIYFILDTFSKICHHTKAGQAALHPLHHDTPKKSACLVGNAPSTWTQEKIDKHLKIQPLAGWGTGRHFSWLSPGLCTQSKRQTQHANSQFIKDVNFQETDVYSVMMPRSYKMISCPLPPNFGQMCPLKST